MTSKKGENMPERRVEKKMVRLEQLKGDTQGMTLGRPMAEVEGRLYMAAHPGRAALDRLAPRGENSNRGAFFEGSLDGKSIEGPVIDLFAALRMELIFLDGDDGKWVEIMQLEAHNG